ncbi:CidA/LrgA family protein [Acinetobacter terrestris]|uniref:CidA/LrgA family protein n=1 Tax=Acinetobacter terrestris TaxID=2529843 RepID=A0AAW6UUF4_9GAMM|nr:CidA/LrgA family protein [Acinetobacter terrestris]MDK1683254.1 CidA/LrgA family protein [Acinetobacter terrestris]TCB48174.1 CidA/LrgA family protein [Acinetobacter terrestris]
MSTSLRSPKLLHLAQIILQLSFLVIIWWVASVIQHTLNLPVSAGVIGLLLVLFALLSGLFKLQWIKTGSDFILGELVLLFIPCVVGIIKYKALFLTQGWQLILAVFIGTICVMLATAYSVYFGFKLEARLKQKHKPHSDQLLKQGE